MIYVGAKQQTEILVESVEEIESRLIVETDKNVKAELEQRKEHIQKIIEKGFGVIKL